MPSFRPWARRAALPAIVLAAFFSARLTAAAPGAPPEREPAGRRIAVFARGDEAALRGQQAEIWDRDESYLISGVTDAALERLAANGVAPLYSAPDRGEGIYILSHVESYVPLQVPGIRRFVIDPVSALYLVPAGVQMDMPNLKFRAMLHGVPRIALPEIKPHPADLAAGLAEAPLAPNPLVQQILNGTSQASWYNFVREVSGDLPVDIPGTTPVCTAAGGCKVLTKYSNAMFPTPNLNGKAFGTEYLLNKGAGWGYTGLLEPYTATESGCTGQITWKNVIFTLPGQVDWGQHQQVLFITHYDTVSYNATENQNYAPGADDAMSGGSALLEAMKVFKDYGFSNTLKIIFFSGEELIYGMCGSTAYTRMHPTADMWRVVNMDQTAYDGNKDKIMNLFNWDGTNCPSCVALGDVYVQANTDYGAPIGAAKLVRQIFKMCQTDHCPFWNVGVTAIDLNENFNEIHPCFDSGQSATCHDDLVTMDPTYPTQLLFDQNYSWPTEKIAIATVATVANPLYACPASGATLTATPQNAQATLSWGAVPPVTNYLIERSPGGCAGPFAGVGSVTGTGFTDTGLTNNTTYGYRIRTCPTQVSNCVAVTPQACVAPGTPSVGTASVPGSNQIRITWTPGAPAPAQYAIYRATGTCAAPGPFARIAQGVAGSPYTDSTVSGGTAYAYQVAGADASGLCESSKAGCMQATATGACTLAPSFAGAATAGNNAAATCGVTLNWAAGSSNCGGPAPTYRVYRSTSSGFTPSGANQIATGLAGTSYNDTAGLSSGVAYYYVVRAVDSLGNSDPNLVQQSAAPTGAVVTLLGDTFEGAGGHDVAGWTTAVGTGTNAWAWSTAQKHSASHSWFDADINSASDSMLVSPAVTPTANSALTFWHTYAFEAPAYDGGTLETAPSPFTTWTVVPDAAFTAGLFNGTIATGSSNPIAGKRAWIGGTVGAMTQVSVSLGAFAGQNIKLRWHEGNDTNAFVTGWYVDDVNVSGAAACTPGCSATAMSSNVLQSKAGANLVENWPAVAGAVTYNVYRNPSANVGTWSGPGVATGLAALTWSDNNQLASATSQFYSVTDVNSCGAESAK